MKKFKSIALVTLLLTGTSTAVFASAYDAPRPAASATQQWHNPLITKEILANN